jgi:hypothetical protein
MHSKFTHLVLTRFNTAVGYAPSLQRLQTDWLRARLVPFERYCLPSIAGQKGASFQWIIFLDSESPAWFKEKMEAYQPLVRPVYITGPLTDEVVASSVAATGLVSTPYLVTTRVDSDDALGNRYLQAIQEAFEEQEREFLEFPCGIQSYRDHLYNCYWPSNPFLSLIERVHDGSQFSTVFCIRHDRVREAGPVRRILRSPQWMHVIHSRNNQSGLRGIPRLASNTHANFEVLWPESVGVDSLATRVKFSVAAYTAWTRRLLGKAATLVSK